MWSGTRLSWHILKLYITLILVICIVHSRDFERKPSIVDEDNFEESSDSTQNRISGGYTVKEGEIPSFVGLIGYNSINLTTSICSGVAIGERLILTAAHCFRNRTKQIFAAPSIWNPLKWKEKGVKTYKVAKLCPSASFNLQTTPPINDFQVLRLQKRIKGIKYAVLAAKLVPIGYKALSAGIGVVNNEHIPFKIADSLQALPVQRVECEKAYDHPMQICFQSYNQQHVGDSCVGDSGGPIYGKTEEGRAVVIALTSFGRPECIEGKNGVSINSNIYIGLHEIINLAKNCSSK